MALKLNLCFNKFCGKIFSKHSSFQLLLDFQLLYAKLAISEQKNSPMKIKITSVTLLLLFLLIQSRCFSQLPYALTTSTQTFQYLASPTVMTSATSEVISWPFPFYMFSTGYTSATVDISNDCYINFGAVGIVSFAAHLNTLDATTQTSYEVTGTSPSRILKLEWKNHGFSSTTAPDDSVSLQIWLYETSNIIEWHFGPNSWYTASLGGPGPFVMLTNGSYYNIYGAPATPSFASCGLTCHLNGIPVQGKVYTLTPVTAGIDEYVNDNIVLYPNPSEGKLTINTISKEEKDIEIFNSMGQKIYACRIANPGLDIDLSDRPKGIYFIKMYSKKGLSVKRMVLQ
jgi:hypothetical protein